MSLLETLRERVVPAGGDIGLSDRALVVAIVVAAAIALAPPLWRVLRVGVTLVHELGHAIVGMAVGRRFTGFVVRGDMSGHAVTVGRPTGPGRVATTWAGYPAPGIVGAVMVYAAARGWAAPLTSLALLALVVVAIRVRSALTGFVLLLALAGTGALWWWRDDGTQAQVLVGVGILLLVGAWRHLATVATGPSRGSDPGVLASLTGVPALVWNASFALVLGLATWLAGSTLLAR